VNPTLLPRRDWLKASVLAGAATALSPRSPFAASAAAPPVAPVPTPASTPAPGIDLGSRRELFVDRFLIDRLENAALKLHEPISGGVAIKLDQPWEGPANAGKSVLHHREKFFLYYRAMTLAKGDDSGALCVATSDDGATWTKPKLGLVERAGRRDTNLVADEQGQPLMMVTPWLDTRPGVPDTERIKAIASEPLSGEKHTAFKDPAGPKRLAFWSSADGFTFRKLARQPVFVSQLRGSFDGGNTMFWSAAEQQYVLYYRWYDGQGPTGRRTVARTTSRDFFTWTEPVPMTYGDTPPEQFYTNNTDPYFRAPHLYLALPARFMEGRRAVTDDQIKAIGLKTSSQGHFFGNDCADAVLLSTRASSTHYDRTFMETFVRPGPGAANWVSRTNYPLTGIHPANGAQLMFFVSRHSMQDTWHLERLLLRTDGFASVNAPWTGGEMVTKPFRFTGHELEINYRTSAPGSVRVELQDAAGKPLPGHALADCVEIIGDEIARTVRWKNGPDVRQHAGQPVRLRFVLRDADLYALQFHP
jgi:hypothetical protein